MTTIDPSIASGLSADQYQINQEPIGEEIIQIGGSAYQYLQSNESLAFNYQGQDYTIGYQESDEIYTVRDVEGNYLNVEIMLNPDEAFTIGGMPDSFGEKITIGNPQELLLDTGVDDIEIGKVDFGRIKTDLIGSEDST